MAMMATHHTISNPLGTKGVLAIVNTPKHRELTRVAQCIPQIRSLIVDSEHIATSHNARGNIPFADKHYANTFVVSGAGFDLGDLAIPRGGNGSIARPPSGGLGCNACANNVDMNPPRHNRSPRQCRW
eukprot:7953205-Pyramimonas_sp.AAC.1